MLSGQLNRLLGFRPMMSPSEPDHSKGVASKSEPMHDDTSAPAGSIRELHAKACALAKLDEAGDLNEKFSEDWVKAKLAAADENLTAIHDYIVHDRKATDDERHGDDGGVGGDMGGGFLISIEKKLSK